MKARVGLIITCAFVLTSLFLFTLYQRKDGLSVYFPERPTQIGVEEKEKEYFREKNRRWSENEYQSFSKSLEDIQLSMDLSASADKMLNSYANGNLTGQWVSRGPYNMPGTFQFCEMDEGTDTVYAVTGGHYGGVQFIWKGTLMGDDWKMINPHNPSRFEDLIVIPNGNSRRVIASHEMGKIIYSDDGGLSWNYSAGITGGIHSTIVNRQNNNVLYATDGKKVFRSVNNGTSFTLFQTIGSTASHARLYSPRWNIQPNALDVYLAVDSKFFKLNSNQTSFTQIGTLPTASGDDGIICLGGDSRKLWMTLGRRKWHASLDGGITWAYQSTTNCWYSTIEADMWAGQYLGVDPEDPNILIGGYSIPLSTRDGGVTTNLDANQYWGYYQNSIGNDPKVRNNFHPDMQANQFFYNKSGQLMTLRSSDGGIFLSYNDWTKTSFPTYSDMTGVYYNISLFGKPTQETFRGGFIYGANNLNDITTGTQDQGWQNTRASTYSAPMVSWDQVGGGDGPCCITGNGIIGWQYDYFGETGFKRIQLYTGSTYKGLSGAGSAGSGQNFTFTGGAYFTPSVGDWSDGNRIWVLSQTLRRIEFNTSNSQITALEKNLTGTSHYIQGLAQSHVTPTLLYAMQNGNIFKSTDKGTTWTQTANQSATGMSGITENKGMGWSSPINSQVVLFAAESGTAVKTILSKDGGITWSNVTGIGPNLFPPAEVNGMSGSQDGNVVFASTNMGPYVFIVSEEKWYPLATDPEMPIFWGQIMYCVKYGGQEVARFSTWGQGVWDFVISSTATAMLDPGEKDKSFSLFPNPASQNIFISRSTVFQKDASIVICNSSGQQANAPISSHAQGLSLDVSKLSNGTYFYKIQENGKETTGKFLVIH